MPAISLNLFNNKVLLLAVFISTSNDAKLKREKK
ncbi:hypothetical protein MNBD_GAMMA08-429 [hydrothermal vent metagenome]|uniref:Uncharacterized protein n=1 Tax=hydrothermal vent metagenome TaxID=652676 RepID=A0A3B0Y216_9ZZZZ